MVENFNLSGPSGHSSLLSGRYVFYENLNIYHPQLYANIQNRFGKIQSGADPAEIASTLYNFASTEQEKEIKALSNMFGYQVHPEALQKKDAYKNIIDAFNFCLSTKDILERNKNKMLLGLEQNIGTGIVADSNFLGQQFIKKVQHYLSQNSPELSKMNTDARNRISNGEDIGQAYQAALRPLIYKAIMDAAIATYQADIISQSRKKQAGYKEFNQKKEEQQFVQYLTDLRDGLQFKSQGELANTNPILDGFIKNFQIEELIESLSKTLAETNKKSKNKRSTSAHLKNEINKVSDNFGIKVGRGGKLQEYVNMAVTELALQINKNSGNIKAVHTGDIGGQFKADSITFNVTLPTQQIVNILKTQVKTEDNRDIESNYRQNALRMEALYDRVKHLNKEGFIIFENDKTGTLNEGFKKRGGFSGGEAIRLNDLDAILSRAKVPGISTFIGTLMQLPKGAIGANNPEYTAAIKNTLARALAYFLFDDVKMLGKEYTSHGTNAIHLFNLNGVFIPLSFFLSAAADAMAATKPNQIFKFNIETPSILYEKGGIQGEGIWTHEDWEAQAEHTLQNTTIQVHFLRNFRQIIGEYLR